MSVKIKTEVFVKKKKKSGKSIPLKKRREAIDI